MGDQKFYLLQQSIKKAICGFEAPLKEKHARATIIGTFQSQGAVIFWTIALQQRMMEHRISAWKFCHLLHKVLREGHPLCCEHSNRNRKWLQDLGRLWGHLKDAYGQCILQYTKFLVHKIEFHVRNPRFPGNVTMEIEELNSIGNGDTNTVYQLCIDVMDYLEEVLALQAAVFYSLIKNGVTSMTNTVQCQIAVLIPCMQDSFALYEVAVALMEKLHSQLPQDVLMGHRERFNNIFLQLQNFYGQCKELKYFVGLVTVPKLPLEVPLFVSSFQELEQQQPVPETTQENATIEYDNDQPLVQF